MTARGIWCCVCVRVFVSAPIPSLSVSLATVRVTSCPADNSSAACAGDNVCYNYRSFYYGSDCSRLLHVSSPREQLH